MARKRGTVLCSDVIGAPLGSGAVWADAEHVALIADGNRGICLAIARRYATSTTLAQTLHVGGKNRII